MVRSISLSILILFFSMQVKALEAVVAHSLFYTADATANGKLIPEAEVYWQVNQRTVHYKTNAEKMIIARIRTNIVFTNNTGIVAHDEFTFETIPRANANDLVKNNIIDLRRYKLPEGMVRMKFVLTDMTDSTNKYVYADSFIITPHADTSFYSEIELLDTTVESAAQTPFRKNGHQQIPICSNFIDENKKVLHYYGELYGADKIAKSDFPLIQKIYIAKKENEAAYDNVVRTDTIPAQSILPVLGSFPIASQPSGNYYLVMSLENNTHQVIASATMLFQRLNPHPTTPPEVVAKKAAATNDTNMESINVLNLSKTFLAKYDMAQIKSILKMLLPFSDFNSTRTIEGFLKKPDEIYMRYYIYNYFAAINKKDPGKAWKEFSAKILEVNKLFSTHGTPGYQTERGFIYLRYGQPSEVITVENEQGALPYEIWQYNTLEQMNKRSMANAVLLFYKPNEISTDYKLLHSNITGEVQNGAWRSFLYVTKDGGTGSNSRAEEYFQK